MTRLSRDAVTAYDDGSEKDILDPLLEEELFALADTVALIYLGCFEPAAMKLAKCTRPNA